VVVSLETAPAEPEKRHAAYRKRLAETARLTPPAPVPASPLLRRLRGREGLRESVLLAEVFGRPRGLEEYLPRG